MIDLNWNAQQTQMPMRAQTGANQAPTGTRPPATMSIPMTVQTTAANQVPARTQTPSAQTSAASRQQKTSSESYQQMLDDAENVNDELGDPPEQEIGYTQENIEMLENPMSVQEAYQTSWKSLLAQNLGRYVVVSFLMGTQQSVVAEGILYEIGNDYLVLYQPVRDSYITADLYSVKFVEFRAADNRNTINSNQT
ncbi:MAG: hypothetical protein Q3995_04675 [Eubacteriales bacterium]|nr:hypothetical protein [Eubacteriales bacterium]